MRSAAREAAVPRAGLRGSAGGRPGLLVVGGDPVLLDALAYSLVRHGYAVRKAAGEDEALELVRGLRPDLVLLDPTLPGGSGVKTCRSIREEDPEVAIVVVSAGEQDRERAFEAGADDYVTKPFGVRELVARISASLRREAPFAQTPNGVIEAGDMILDAKNASATAGGEPLSLRPKEFELLAALAAHPGELKSREQLAREVWGNAWVGSSRTIDVHVRRIRAALSERSDYEYVHTVRGLGYRFQAEPKETG